MKLFSSWPLTFLYFLKIFLLKIINVNTIKPTLNIPIVTSDSVNPLGQYSKTSNKPPPKAIAGSDENTKFVDAGVS